MFKSYVGTSTNPAPRSAGREAAAVKAADLKEGFVYAGCDCNVPEVLAAMGGALPGVPLFGNTSFTGIITQDGYSGAG